MSPPADPRPSKVANDVRQIGSWSRTYAQNRSLGVVVGLTVNLLLILAIFLPSFLAGWAYHTGNWFVLGLLLVILAVGLLGVVYFSVPRWGGRWIARLTERLYAGEGSARVLPPHTRGRRWLGGLLAGLFALCIVMSIVLGFLGILPERFFREYLQPLSATYCVPFLVGLWLLMRPAVGPIALVWPALYALHAVLIVAGVPIVFTGPWEMLNVLVPMCGYGLLSALLSHLYSRLALRRLRRLAGGVSREAEGSQS